MTNGAIHAVEIQARQLLRASRVLEGKTQHEALRLLPMIYHVCARAHAFAAQQAFACALGTTVPAPLMHQLLVLAETCREHARRIFMDWPALYGQTMDTEAVLEIQRRLQPIEQSVRTLMTVAESPGQNALLQHVQALHAFVLPLLGEINGELEVGQLLQKVCNARGQRNCVPQVLQAMQEQAMADIGNSDVPSLCIHEVDSLYLAEQLGHDVEGKYIAAPHLHQQVYETGPLARMRDAPLLHTLLSQYGNGLMARFCAMVLELATIPQAMLNLLQEQDMLCQQSRSLALAAETGMGGVEAARGFLWHRVEMAQGRIKRYHILAPTEWNFHPQGALFRGLLGLRVQAKTQLHKLAAMITTALDPCVAYEIQVI